MLFRNLKMLLPLFLECLKILLLRKVNLLRKDRHRLAVAVLLLDRLKQKRISLVQHRVLQRKKKKRKRLLIVLLNLKYKKLKQLDY